MNERKILTAVILLQALGLVFFADQILLALAGVPIRPVPWQFYEMAEILAALSLAIGVVVGMAILRRSIRQRDRFKNALHTASSAFADIIEQRFGEWGHTQAERDVALFAIKGMSTS